MSEETSTHEQIPRRRLVPEQVAEFIGSSISIADLKKVVDKAANDPRSTLKIEDGELVIYNELQVESPQDFEKHLMKVVQPVPPIRFDLTEEETDRWWTTACDFHRQVSAIAQCLANKLLHCVDVHTYAGGFLQRYCP